MWQRRITLMLVVLGLKDKKRTAVTQGVKGKRVNESQIDLGNAMPKKERERVS